MRIILLSLFLLLCCSVGIADEIPYSTEGLVGWWKMNEASWNGTADEVVDSSGYGNHGTAENGATTVAQGVYSRAGSFDGDNDYVDCGNDESLNITDVITIEAWAKRVGESRIALSKGEYKEDGWYLDFRIAGVIIFKVSIQDDCQVIGSSAGTVPDGVWTHMAIVADNGNTVSFYFNGEFDKSVAMNFAYAGNVNRHLVIGAYSTEGGLPFNGTIDEVRIYNRALSAEEIKLNYRRGAKYRGLTLKGVRLE